MGPVQPPRQNNNRPQGDGEKPPEASWPKWAMWLIALMFLAIIGLALFRQQSPGASISANSFYSQLNEKNVAKAQIDNATGSTLGEFKTATTVEGTNFKKGDQFSTVVNLNDQNLNNTLASSGANYSYTKPDNNIFGSVLMFFLPILLLIGVMVWLNRRAQGQMGSIMQIGRSRAKVYTTDKPKTTFADVAGHEGPKQEIKEVVSFLKEPKKFKDLGANIPKGVLLVGPPGTGKTLLARAVAGEAGVPFIAVTGSDFMEMFVGVGAARVRDLFQTARKQAPAVIFIDEIDSIGRKRGAGVGGGHDEREQTLNQLLSEMDGFEGSDGIVMMAATNRPDILDSALMRPGRFDRQIVVPLPTQSERLDILRVHTIGKKIDPDVKLDTVARGTPGFSGADLANLTNEAALHAVRAGHTLISRLDFDDARDRVLMGIKRESLAMNDEEKKITAYHEAGHALCGALTPEADELHKVTILPVGMALGVTQFLPEESHIEPKEAIEAHLTVMLGGRVAEEIVFGRPSTGAQNDLQQATKLAKKMVREWGMSDKLGPVAFGSDSEAVFLGDEIARGHEYSEETARVIDEEISRIVGDARRQATHLLSENRKALDLVARTLLEKETIVGEEVHRLVRVSRGEIEPERAEPAEPAPETAAAMTAPDTEAPVQPDRQPHKGFLPPPMAPGVAH